VKNILDFGFYVSFFPQLVAGPIVRASEFVPQIYKKFDLSRAEFGLAIFMILNGLLKKMWVSDYIAVNFIDRVFSNPQLYGGVENLLALYGYSIQVYLDFSGYTDIAIGVALLLGFRLPQNFNSPYKATSTGEFWKRWHISLSTWLKDYLYIPLGGNRKGKFRTNINLMITMLLGGLWHGASWKFVIWGGLNGVGLVVYKLWRKISPFKGDNRTWVKIYSIFLTFNFITFTRIWFRADNTEKANALMYQIVHSFDIEHIGQIISTYKGILLLMLFAYVVHWLPTKIKDWYKNTFINFPHWAKAIVAIIVVFLIYQTRTAEVQPFIYFQF
jgi:D-alanyl-lipoteichoic acid acyltransferase DltB (MBOAT superfamily)